MKRILLAILVAVAGFVAWRGLADGVADRPALPDPSGGSRGSDSPRTDRLTLSEGDGAREPIAASETPAAALGTVERAGHSEAAAAPMAADPGTQRDAIRPDPELNRLVRRRDELKSVLNELTAPLLSQQVEDGSAEFLGPSASYTTRKGDNATIFAIYTVPDRGTFRSSISRESRPDLYQLKDELLDLELRIDGLQRKLAQAGAPQPK